MPCVALKSRIYSFLSLRLEDIHMLFLLFLMNAHLNSLVLVMLHLLDVLLLPYFLDFGSVGLFFIRRGLFFLLHLLLLEDNLVGHTLELLLNLHRKGYTL